MNILIIKNAEWNDSTFPNNLLTNWFEGTNAKFANVYCGPGLPLNTICDSYFRITDGQLLKSLFLLGRAGNEIHCDNNKSYERKAKINLNRQGVYGIFKKISLIARTPVMLFRDFLWMRGRYNKKALREFIEDFKPDIVLTYRVFNPQIYQLERLVYKYAKAPIVAYTGDDEILSNCHSLFGVSQLRRIYTRYLFNKQSSLYSYYFTHSADLCNFYTERFNIPSSVIHKGANFDDFNDEKQIHNPIKLVYAGRLCYGRWKTIVEIGKNIDKVNKDGIRMLLYVYSQDIISHKMKSEFDQIKSLNFCGSVDSGELMRIYHDSDIALHIESFEKKYFLITRYSFSTKIVDLMNSTCAIMAVCEEKQAGYKYLKENEAAFTVSSYDYLYDELQNIANNPSMIALYAKRAWELGKKNHDKSNNRRMIMNLLSLIAQKQA